MLIKSRTKNTFNIRKNLTDKAADNLVKVRDHKKSQLINENETSIDFFDASRTKDYVREKAKKDVIIREDKTKKVKRPPETRYEVLDYYEMNRKVINKTYELQPGELDIHFKNIKKLTPLLYRKKKEDVDVSKEDPLSLSCILPNKKLTKEEMQNSVARLAKPKKKN
jgi:hypothetical protein